MRRSLFSYGQARDVGDTVISIVLGARPSRAQGQTPISSPWGTVVGIGVEFQTDVKRQATLSRTVSIESRWRWSNRLSKCSTQSACASGGIWSARISRSFDMAPCRTDLLWLRGWPVQIQQVLDTRRSRVVNEGCLPKLGISGHSPSVRKTRTTAPEAIDPLKQLVERWS